ncbi:dynamin family protein [Bacillus hominis]|uniref:dynamin family protein n=1 Tax=Bacillus hominis TaxID=2817478 RepID=UPI001BB44BFF|nr:dynamin family protein [Bacillus hominis]
MNYEERKTDLFNKIQVLRNQVCDILPQSPQIRKFDGVLLDLKEDLYTVVVVGEFKNGKSTFVNALLGEPLLPVDVTPTTAAIHALVWGSERSFEVHKSDGTVERSGLQAETLQKYVATADFNPDEVNYLKLCMPAPLLKNKVVLVDTPGVNDLNKHRSNITYEFIPRADVVLFMLDMTAPLKRTEEQFINNSLLGKGLDRLIFVANFADRVDEEEVEELSEFISHRIQRVTEIECPRVFPISAREGLEAKQTKDEELWEYSGLGDVEKNIWDIIQNGSCSEEKLMRYYNRVTHILYDALEEIQVLSSVNTQSLEELEKSYDSLNQWDTERLSREQKINEYVQARENEIQLIIYKSVDFLGESIRDEVKDRIQLYNGHDMGNFIETQIPLIIKNRLKRWIDQYSGYIQELLRKLEIELSKGLSQIFDMKILMQKQVADRLTYDVDVEMHAPNKMNPLIASGAIVGGASTIAMVFGGPMFIPIIGLAGLPYIQKKMIQKQLDEIKPKLLVEVDHVVSQVMEDFMKHIAQYVSEGILEIKRHTMCVFQDKVDAGRHLLGEEIKQKKLVYHNKFNEQEKVEKVQKAIVAQYNYFIKEVERNERLFSQS